jgi:hypothetical protein
MTRWAAVSTIAVIGMLVFDGMPPVHARTMKECSAKYQAAQQAGTLHGMKWNDFRKAECGASAAATPAEAATPTAATSSKSVTPSKGERAPIGNAVFPTAVSPKYSGESAGKARLHTCLDQYNANKGRAELDTKGWRLL